MEGVSKPVELTTRISTGYAVTPLIDDECEIASLARIPVYSRHAYQ